MYLLFVCLGLFGTFLVADLFWASSSSYKSNWPTSPQLNPNLENLDHNASHKVCACWCFLCIPFMLYVLISVLSLFLHMPFMFVIDWWGFRKPEKGEASEAVVCDFC